MELLDLPELDEDRYIVWWRGLKCPLGDTQMFQLMKLLVEAAPRRVPYIDITENCLDIDMFDEPDKAIRARIRAMKRRLVNRLANHGMADLADAIRGEKEHYWLDLS